MALTTTPDNGACTFDAASYCLASLYCVLFLWVTRYLVILFRRRRKRVAQKVFLLCCLVQCAGRATFFFLWPNDDKMPCSPTVYSSGTLAMNLLGNLPGCFFLSAFSITCFTFARIYHGVLDAGTYARGKFEAVVTLLVVINLCIYATIIRAVVLSTDGDLDQHTTAYEHQLYDVAIVVIAISTFLIALGFLAYAILLFRYFSVRGVSGTGAGGLSPAIHAARRGRPKTPETPRTDPTGRNPMRTLLWVAIVCMLCFLSRAIMLPVQRRFGHAYPWMRLLVYLMVSEICPTALMLCIFDVSPDEDPGDIRRVSIDSTSLLDGIGTPDPYRVPSGSVDAPVNEYYAPGSMGSAGSLGAAAGATPNMPWQWPPSPSSPSGSPATIYPSLFNKLLSSSVDRHPSTPSRHSRHATPVRGMDRVASESYGSPRTPTHRPTGGTYWSPQTPQRGIL